MSFILEREKLSLREKNSPRSYSKLLSEPNFQLPRNLQMFIMLRVFHPINLKSQSHEKHKMTQRNLPVRVNTKFLKEPSSGESWYL